MNRQAPRALLTLLVVATCQVVTRVRDPPTWLPVALGSALAAIALWWALAERRAPQVGGRSRAMAFVLRLAPVASVVFSIAERRRLLLAAPDWLLGLLAFGALLSALSFLGSRAVWLSVGCAVLAGIALRLFDFAVVPIDPQRADMIPLVLSAFDRLAHGQCPYGMYEMPWRVPLTYLPLTWLSFVPAILAGVDPRWSSTVSELAFLALLVHVGGGRRTPESVLLLFAAWFAASSLVASDALTAMPVQSLALGATAGLVAVRSRAAPLAVGFALATTPLAGALVALVSIRWWCDGPKALARRLAEATAIATLLVLPWVLWSPAAFVAGPVRWFNDLAGFPRQTWLASHAWARVAGFTGVFWTHGWERLLRPVQAVLVLALAAGYARTRSRLAEGDEPSAWVGACVATLLALLLFNVIVWPYLYESASALALVAVAVSEPRRA